MCYMLANPSINTDWRDKAAPAGYVKRYALNDLKRKRDIARFEN